MPDPRRGGSPQRGPGPRGQAWDDFGRRMFPRFLAVVFIVVLALVGLGALLAVLLGSFEFGTVAGAIVLTPLVLVMIGAVVGRGAGRTWRPIRALIDAAGSLADGDYAARVERPRSRTLGPVVDSFNEMAGRLEAADDQRRRLLADLGHELRTPLTVIRGEIEAIIDGVHEPDPERLALLLDEVTMLERLLEDLSTLSHAEGGSLALHLEEVDLAALVTDVAEAHRRLAAEAGVALVVDTAPADERLVDPVRIRAVVANLLINAIRATGPDGTITITVDENEDGPTIVVSDDGTGIEAEELDRVFDRFHRGPRSDGSGLGLTISRDLIEAHGGSVSIDSSPGRGTRVLVTLPNR